MWEENHFTSDEPLKRKEKPHVAQISWSTGILEHEGRDSGSNDDAGTKVIISTTMRISKSSTTSLYALSGQLYDQNTSLIPFCSLKLLKRSSRHSPVTFECQAKSRLNFGSSLLISSANTAPGNRPDHPEPVWHPDTIRRPTRRHSRNSDHSIMHDSRCSCTTQTTSTFIPFKYFESLKIAQYN